MERNIFRLTGLDSERRTAIDSIELLSPRIIGNILAENGFGVQQPPPAQSVLNIFGAFCGQLVTHDTGSRINVQRNSKFFFWTKKLANFRFYQIFCQA